MKTLLALAFILLAMTTLADDEMTRNMRAFPAADPGMKRFVIHLPAKKAEENFRVQLLIGKKVMTDGINRHFFGGQLVTETIQGWGFDRFILPQLGPMAGTLMAPSPGTKPVERFVTLGGEPQLLRYNSRLPLVVYVPEGVEVRYRIWRADGKDSSAKEG